MFDPLYIAFKRSSWDPTTHDFPFGYPTSTFDPRTSPQQPLLRGWPPPLKTLPLQGLDFRLVCHVRPPVFAITWF